MDNNNLTYKRISVFAGHYGSGKTNIAINYALYIKEKQPHVAIADLDIVNPYFRTKDSEKMLTEHGIHLISSEYADSNVDLPALPAETYAVIENADLFSVLDVGGDDRGALALGRYSDAIKEENAYDMFFVINKFRPMTRDADSTVEIMREIESAASMRFTAIVNNSNLGAITTPEDIISSRKYAEEISEKANIPIAFTTARADIAYKLDMENVMPINIYVQQSWLREKE